MRHLVKKHLAANLVIGVACAISLGGHGSILAFESNGAQAVNADALESSRVSSLRKVSEQFIYETAPFPSCHASTIEQSADGTIVAAWFGGEHEKADDVGIWVSRLDGDKWSVPVEVANGVQHSWSEPQVIERNRKQITTDVHRYPTWNPVLFQPKEGPLLLFYKAGPNPDAWWGMLSESHDNGLTWSRGERLPEGILGPIKNKPIQLADGTILCPSSNETPGEDDRWNVHFESYDPVAKTWSRTPPLHDGKEIGAIQPSILVLGDNKLLSVGRTRQGKLFEIASEDNGKSWGKIGLIDLPNPNSGTDAVTLKSGEHLLVYNHVTKESQEWGGRRSPLNVALSLDGRSWEQAIELENEPKKEFSYPAVIQTQDGRIHITYTWHRLKIKHVVLEVVD